MYALISRKCITNIRWFKYVHISKIDNNRMRKTKVKKYLTLVHQYLVNARDFKFQNFVFPQVKGPLELRN